MKIIFAQCGIFERLLLNEKTPGLLASGGEEFSLGPETSLDSYRAFV